MKPIAEDLLATDGAEKGEKRRGNDPVRKGLGGGDSDWAVKKLKSVN